MIFTPLQFLALSITFFIIVEQVPRWMKTFIWALYFILGIVYGALLVIHTGISIR